MKNTQQAIYSLKKERESNKLNELKNEYIIKRGDVFFAKLDGGKHIQSGIRPVIIIQNNIGNKYSPVVSVVPVTSKVKNNLPIHVEINEYFLDSKSIALCEQTIVIEKQQLLYKVGKLSLKNIGQVENALMIQFGIKKIEQNKYVS